jgi:hypothetical protein
MEDKPGLPKGTLSSRARTRKIKAEIEEITKRTQEALQRSRAIIEKSKGDSAGDDAAESGA